MALLPSQRAVLESLSVEEVRQQLAYAGANRGAAVPGLGDGMIARSDVQDWLVEQEKKKARAQTRRDVLQGVAIALSVISIFIAIASFIVALRR